VVWCGVVWCGVVWCEPNSRSIQFFIVPLYFFQQQHTI
jgi:hypothetical protein